MNLSNYATKSDLKNAIGVDISDFAKKADLAKLKSDPEKLKTVPVDLKKLSDVIHKNLPNKLKQGLDEKNEGVENKIPDVSILVINTAFNTKIGEVENKTPDVAN